MKTLTAIGTAIVAACILAMQSAGPRPCDHLPYTPNVPSGAYIRVTGAGIGVRSDAARSNYRCEDGRLIETAPVR